MAKINTTINFDYENAQYKITAMGTGSDWNSSANVIIIDPRGFQAAFITLPINDNAFLGYPIGHCSGDFAISMGAYNHVPTSQTVLNYTEYSTSLNLQNEPSLVGLSGVIKTIATGTLPQYVAVSKVDNVYSGIPILIERGDAVPVLYVDTVTNKNLIKYNSALLSSSSLTGTQCKFTDCIGEIINGAYSGTKFYVSTHTPASSGILIDRDATAWSGAYFKLKPYRTITAYSGWKTYTGQEFGVNAAFTLDAAISIGIGSVNSSASHLSSSTLNVGDILGIGTISGVNLPVTNAAVIMPSSSYQYDFAVGDVIQYSQSGTLATKFATILAQAPNSPITGFNTVSYWPTGIIAPSPDASVAIFRSNTYKVLNYPKFDSNYEVLIQHTNGIVDAYVARTPTATVEMSANEFDSTYSAVGDVTHFHVGPVHLSNGDVLKQNYLLRYVISMYQGDVTSSTPLTTWKAHGTMGTDVGLVTQGSYFKNGVYTATYEQIFNASETLIMDLTVGTGGAKVHKIVTIPIQPSA